MKKFFTREIPVYAAVILVLLVIGLAVAAIWMVRDIVYNYEITLSGNGTNQAFTYGSWPALADADFYNQVLNRLIAEKATFMSADLSGMKLRYYANGALDKEFNILAKGKIGSWWETPAGLYKVEAKIPKDYSSFAHVYSPWALQFQGNFLIHGWPYYPNGAPVGSTYSGGCIRLSTEDAKALYDLAGVGIPVLVSSANFQIDAFREQTQEPPVTARNYLAADLKSNFVLAEKDSDEQVPIASVAKLMTALVAVEYVNIEKTITITPDMIVKTSLPRLKVGQAYSLYDLLQPLLKESSNESAAAIADFLGPQYFVRLMNQTAQSIGMTHTHFTDSSGSDWGNVSTAQDLFLLAQYLYNNRSFILKMTTNNSDPNAYGPSRFTNLENFNVFVDDPSFAGGKVGLNGGASGTILSVFKKQFSLATETSTASTTVERPFVLVILGSNDYEADARNFLAWIENTYH